MMGGTGHVRDFSKPNPDPPDGQKQQQGVQIVGGGGYKPPTENPGPDAPEINIDPGASPRLYERVVTDEDKLRATMKTPGDPEVRVRILEDDGDVTRDDDVA